MSFKGLTGGDSDVKGSGNNKGSALGLPVWFLGLSWGPTSSPGVLAGPRGIKIPLIPQFLQQLAHPLRLPDSSPYTQQASSQPPEGGVLQGIPCGPQHSEPHFQEPEGWECHVISKAWEPRNQKPR